MGFLARPLAPDIECDLGRITEAAWIIDLDRAQVVSASRAGRAWSGGALRDGAVLDRAMPGLQELARLEIAAGEQERSLLLWIPRELVRLRCHCRILTSDPRTALVIAAQEAEQADAATSAVSQASDATERAMLAHELRTPLSAIAALAEVMMEERLGPMGNARYLAYAADIRESAVHALGVLGAMIEGAEGAPDPTEHKETDLHEAVGTCLSMMRELANGVSVRLEAHLMPGRPRIAVGHRSLVQMLLNLVSNALKFTPPGGVVRVATRLQSDGELSLSVIDTGSGISREELVRIEAAGPFPAGAGPASRHSGYGLPIVQALARAEGLRVELASVPGQGTTASIIFPRQRLLGVDCTRE